MDPVLIAIIVVAVGIGLFVILRTGGAPPKAPEAAVQAEEAPQTPALLTEEPLEPTVLQPPDVPVILDAPPAPLIDEISAVEVEAPDVDLAQAEADLEVIEAEAVPPPPKRGVVSRIGRALSKTRSALGERLSVLSSRDRLTDEDYDEVEEALIRADLGVKAATSVVQALRDGHVSPADLTDALVEQLAGIMSKGEADLRAGAAPSVWLVTGVNGVGKTTSIAKLANKLKSEGKTVVLAAADTFRAAAIDQLGTWAERLGVHMVKHETGSDPGAVVYDAVQHARAKGVDVVIVDTAGRLHTKTNLMEELKKVRRVAEKDAGSLEVLLVLDATVGQNGISQARTFQEAIDVDGVILTKLDGTARGGIVVAIQEELGIPVKAIGVGEAVDDLEPFDPKSFAKALIEEA